MSTLPFSKIRQRTSFGRILITGVFVISFGFGFRVREAIAEEKLTSGIAVGEFVVGFESTKCGGATGDGVKTGSELCYVCKYEERPVVLIFARTAGPGLARLVQQLDALIPKHKKKQLAGIVTLIGAEATVLQKRAKQFALRSKISHVPVLVPLTKTVNGPKDFQLSTKADVTVLMYVAGTVKANFALSAKSLTQKNVKRILADVSKIVQ